MNKDIILTALVAGLAGAVAGQLFSGRPVIAQPFGMAGASNGVAAAAPSASGVSHAWTVDLRTNSIVMCRADAAGEVRCTQKLMPGAAQPVR